MTWSPLPVMSMVAGWECKETDVEKSGADDCLMSRKEMFDEEESSE